MDMPAVIKLLDAYWDRRLPVDVNAISARLGFKMVSTGPFDPNPENHSLSGYAAINNSGERIVAYNPMEPHYRARFTIAHEIGHHYLGHTQFGHCYRDSNATYQDNIEAQANEFAAQLLMPEEAVNFYVRQQGVLNITQLSNIFNVSESAMYFRLKNLGFVS
ncbi:UNVERIFIED_CONTAM: ImmA/IrrE family metallo-endopeptidase [Aeromonas hydrophila]